ncbi:MAG: hypothetical protein PHF60_02295 [Candidatus ainarchaeum sp.]|nr:hypothetical protein [Candidatus ainarchaeum sp.]
MAVKREVLLIILLLIVIAVLIKLVEFFQINIIEADASNFVREDLHSKYPLADIEVMTITPKYNENGAKYFEVKARVTEEAETACPERLHIFYNYPAQNFVPQPPEVITHNCVVCAQGICTIAFPEEAIIASHTFEGTSEVNSYIQSNGNAIPTVTEKPDSWEVMWDSETADHYYVVSIHRNGEILGVELVGKV